MLSIATDYAADKGDPSPYLRRIADAGFTHVHWCHQWNTDFVYMDAEIEQIGKWLNEYGLELLDLHGSVGPEKSWLSAREYERLAGVALVKNRIEMTARLGGDAVVMHIPGEPGSEPLHRSLSELEPFARERGVRIAVENGVFAAISDVLSQYSPEYVGLCYDSGHGNMSGEGLDRLAENTDRLCVLHLHDNDGKSDQHQVPFMGTIDWKRLAGIVAKSAYSKPVQMEVSMKQSGFEDEIAFLDKAREVGVRIAELIESAKS
ncbi:MAG TPA: sugar phosphate isomerase/epimerase [Firmicutes bacterium]|mgnify:CR=1 FL=1|nr:sugar phosphate isomerase/epimerase [Bacillota bacterium]